MEQAKEKTPLKRVVIKRSKWARVKADGQPFGFKDTNTQRNALFVPGTRAMCCLGFLENQIAGIPKSHMCEVTMPKTLAAKQEAEGHPITAINEEWMIDAAVINDRTRLPVKRKGQDLSLYDKRELERYHGAHRDMTDRQQETALKKLAKANGYEFVFVD